MTNIIPIYVTTNSSTLWFRYCYKLSIPTINTLFLHQLDNGIQVKLFGIKEQKNVL